MIQKLERGLLFSIILFLPTQLGKHFWPPSALVEGLRIDYLSPTLYFTDILIILLFIIWFSQNISRIKMKLKPGIPLLVVALIFGIVTSLSPAAGWYKFAKIIEFIFLGFFIAQNLKVKKDLPWVLLLLSAGVAFESVLAIIQFVQKSSLGGPLWFLGERTFSGQTPGIANAVIDGRLILRPYGTFSHPNVLAGYLVIAMTFILYNFKKLFSGIILILGTIALFITLSRVAIILWLGVVVFWLTKRFKKKHIAVFSFLLVILILASPLSSRFTSLIDSDNQTVTRRQELNSAAIEMVKSSPVFGVGLNNFLNNLPHYQKPTSGPLWLQPVHNIYLLILAETGIVGLGFFLWFIWRTYKRSKRNYFYLTVLSAFLTLGFFDHYFLTQQQGQLLLTLVFAYPFCQDS